MLFAAPEINPRFHNKFHHTLLSCRDEDTKSSFQKLKRVINFHRAMFDTFIVPFLRTISATCDIFKGRLRGKLIFFTDFQIIFSLSKTSGSSIFLPRDDNIY